MSSTTASRRYAKGLLELALESGRSDTLLTELSAIGRTLAESADLRRYLSSPVVKNEAKRTVLGEIFPKASDVVGQLFRILAGRGRLNILGSITRAYQEAYNVHHGIVDARIYTAYELGAVELEALRQALEVKTGKTVRATAGIDTALMGGVTVRIGDTVYDGSVRNSLDKLDVLLHVPTA